MNGRKKETMVENKKTERQKINDRNNTRKKETMK